MDSPTHRQGNVLDLVLPNIDDSIHSLTVHNNNRQFISSDHYPITFEIFCSVKTSIHNSPTYVYDFPKGTMKAFHNSLLTAISLTVTIQPM